VINRAIEHPAVKFADAVLAFATVLICLRPHFLSVLAAKSLNAIEISVRDAIAVAIFIFMWQWVFGSLKAYNRFTTVSSRILAVLKGVVLMAVPTMFYVRIVHPDWIESVRPALFLVVGLFAFEIGQPQSAARGHRGHGPPRRKGLARNPHPLPFLGGGPRLHRRSRPQ
jgi:FlaA1/EpsC-like NDP-sugar epimerase